MENDCTGFTGPDQRILVLLVFSLFLAVLCLINRQDRSLLNPSPTHSTYMWLAGDGSFKAGIYRLPLNTSVAYCNSAAMPGSYISKLVTASGEGEKGLLTGNRFFTQKAPMPPHVAPFFFRPIAINRASKDVLTFLPGIGERLAEHIINDRQKHGYFRDESEITRLDGLDQGKLRLLRPLLSYE